VKINIAYIYAWIGLGLKMQRVKKRRGTGQVTLFDEAKHTRVGAMTVYRALRPPNECQINSLCLKVYN
jgi:hypothetical protein